MWFEKENSSKPSFLKRDKPGKLRSMLIEECKKHQCSSIRFGETNIATFVLRHSK